MFLLQECSFEVVYCLGRKHVMAHHLSRIESNEPMARVVDKIPDVSMFTVHLQPKEGLILPIMKCLTHRLALSPDTTEEEQSKIWRLSEPYILGDGRLIRISSSKQVEICIFGNIIEDVISEAHEQERVHPHLQQTWHLMLAIYYSWPTLKNRTSIIFL